jgi:hypothetical protein
MNQHFSSLSLTLLNFLSIAYVYHFIYFPCICLYAICLIDIVNILLFLVISDVYTYKSLIHFELILVKGDKHESSFSFLQIGNHFSQQHLLQRLSFLHRVFGTFVKYKEGVAAWIHIRVLYSVPVVFISVFVSIPCYFYCYCFVI